MSITRSGISGRLGQRERRVTSASSELAHVAQPVPWLSSILPVDLAEESSPARVREIPSHARNVTRAFKKHLRGLGVSLRTYSYPPLWKCEQRSFTIPTSPIGKLPVELLSVIFEMAVFSRSYNDRRRLFRPLQRFFATASVCSHWAKVFIGCPALWALAASYAPSIPAMRRLLLRSVNPSLHLSTLGSARTADLAEDLATARSFECYADYIDWSSILTKRHLLPNIQFLWLQRPGTSPINRTMLINAPVLETLRMDAPTLLIGSSLRNLVIGLPKFTSDTPTDVRNVLEQSPRLQVLYIEPPQTKIIPDVDWQAVLQPLSGGPLREMHLLVERFGGASGYLDLPPIHLPHAQKLVILWPIRVEAPMVHEVTTCNPAWTVFLSMLRGVTNTSSLTVRTTRLDAFYTPMTSGTLEFNNLSAMRYTGSVNQRLLAILNVLRAPLITMDLSMNISTHIVEDDCSHSVNYDGKIFEWEHDKLCTLRTALQSHLRSQKLLLRISSFVELYSDTHRVEFTVLDDTMIQAIGCAEELRSAGFTVSVKLPLYSCEHTRQNGYMNTSAHVLSAFALEAVEAIQMPIFLSLPRHDTKLTLVDDLWQRVPLADAYPDWTLPRALNMARPLDMSIMRANLERMIYVHDLDLTLLRTHEDQDHDILRMLSGDHLQQLLPALRTIKLRGLMEQPSMRVGVGAWWNDIIAIASLRSHIRIEFLQNFCCCRNTPRVHKELKKLERTVESVVFTADSCRTCY